MGDKWLARALQAAVIAVVLAAVCQELEKPTRERKWRGKVAGVVPYNFRLPSAALVKESYWNPYESRIFTPAALGVGWAINLYALLENLRIIGLADVSEESFLMPTRSIKEMLKQAHREDLKPEHDGLP